MAPLNVSKVKYIKTPPIWLIWLMRQPRSSRDEFEKWINIEKLWTITKHFKRKVSRPLVVMVKLY